ncbi:MAG: chemotaxis protein CheA [Cryobacterium sp.]|nr:chemotaxis protein CheA [Oligoflexia bacterium]
MDDFEKELKIGFLQEASQLLQDTEQCFLTLESNPEDPGILDQIFRLAHNLKGSSKAVGFDAMGAFTHEFESLLLKIKNGEVGRSTSAVNLLLRCNDHLKVMVDALTGDLGAVVDSVDLTAEVKLAQTGVFSDAESAPAATSEAVSEAVSESVSEPISDSLFPDGEDAFSTPMVLAGSDDEMNRIPAELSDKIAAAFEIPDDVAIDPEDLMRIMAAETQKHLDGHANASPHSPLPTETPLERAPPALSLVPASAAPSTTPNPSKQAPKSTAPAVSGGAEDSIRVSLVRLERLLNFVGEMVILQSVLREQSQQAEASITLRKTVDQLGKVSKEIQDISMSLRMVPVKATFQKMQRIVRDTAQALHKKVNLNISGEETELDKTVLEHLGDPLVHIIRNAVDHGIESGAERLANGKLEGGNVSLSAYHQGGRLVIEVKDDGGGINTKVLIQKAIEKGILRPGQTLSEKEAVHLIFHPGFSTKAEVTEVSGRGVGMDVVRTNIEKLSGDIQIDTVLGSGTTFKIFLPLTLAIIDGMVVKSGGDRFILPLAHVHESLKPDPKDMQFNSGFGETLLLRGENLPFYRLNQLLSQKVDVKKAHHDGIAIIVRATGKPFAILVDDIVGQNQIVIKRLGAELAHLKGFSGSAILGDGRPSLILELPELITKNVITRPHNLEIPEKTA